TSAPATAAPTTSASSTATPSPTAPGSSTPAAAGAANPTPSATPLATAGALEEEQPGATFNEELPGGGGHNNVNAVNRVDNRRLVRGSVKLVHVPGPSAAPVNEARAFASCIACQTFSVALE